MTHPITLITLVLAIVLTAFTAPIHAAPVQDPLLEMLPADAVFCVRINQFNTSLGKMDQYLRGASPLPVSLAMLAGMQMGCIVGDPMLTGIDQEGTFAAVGIAMDDKSIDMSVIVPMIDYEEFIKTNPACKPSEQANVTLLSAPNSPVGVLLMMPLLGGKYALVNSENNADALVSMHKKLTAKAAALSASLDAAQAAQAAAAPAWAYINIARLYALYGQDMLDGISAKAQQIPQEEAMSAAMNFSRQMLEAMMKTFAGQADALTLALTPDAANLSLEMTLKAQKGTDLAAALIANPNAAAGFTLAGLADDRDAVNAVFKMNKPSMEKFNAMMLEVMTAAMGDTFSDADKQQLADISQKSLNAMGKQGFVGFRYDVGTPPFAMREVIEVAEPDFIKTTAPEGLAVVNRLYKAMNMPFTLTYQPDVESYMNVPIGVVKVQMQDTNDEALKTAMQMYGPDGLSYYTAQKDNLMFITIAPDSKQALKALIDAPTDKPAASDLQKAMAILGDSATKTDLVAGINYLKLVKGFMGIAGQMGDPQASPMMAAMAEAMDVPTQSCMAVGIVVADGKATTRFVLPKQHLSEIMTAVMKVQQVIIQQQMPPQSPQNDDTPVNSKDPLQSWVGKAAPNVAMTDLQGKKINLADLKGKKVVLDFWATWCPPCKKMIPDLITLRSQTRPQEIVLIGISDEPVDRLNKFAKDYKINYPVISHTGSLPSPFDQVTGLPTTFFIDAQGVIRQVVVGYHSLDEIKMAIDAM